jgi:hypothetical protein
MVVNYAQIRR